MAKNRDNVRAYGDELSGVWVADKGTTAPTTPTAVPATGWEELGWLSDDGVTEMHSVDSSAKRAWQGGATVRTIKSGDSRKFKFVMWETTALTMGLLRPGSSATTATGVTTTHVKTFLGQDIRAWIIDTVDDNGSGDVIHTRKIIPTGEVVDVADIKFNSQDVTAFEVTVECYPDTNGVLYDELTDDPALAVA